MNATAGGRRKLQRVIARGKLYRRGKACKRIPPSACSQVNRYRTACHYGADAYCTPTSLYWGVCTKHTDLFCKGGSGRDQDVFTCTEFPISHFHSASSQKCLELSSCAAVISRQRSLKTVKLLTTRQPLIHMFTYVSVFPPHEACKSLSYTSVTLQWGLVITATTFQHHLGQRSMQLEGIPSGFCSTDRSGWLMSLRFKATSSLRSHCSINWVLVPLCM